MSEIRTSTARKPTSMNSALTAAKSNVVQQAKLMDSAGTAWHAVKYGNLEMITRLFPSQCNVYSKGPVGENVFHIAMLLNTPSTLAIGKYLVKLYGKTLVNTPYQERKTETDPPGQYEGETALHIAIVNHDFDMVKFLVQNGADVRARAYGSFFQPGSAVYYGEYPLSFAACTGQKDIVSYLKRHGARVNHDRDQWGNTALHMCVYHDQPDMYDHLVEYCGASEHVQNNRSQTPLLLAASLGKVEMLQHIYNKRRRVAWAYGPVTSYSLSLREIDTVQNPGEYVPSAIETSVRKGHLEVLGDPLVQTLLQTKWQRFGKTWYLVQVSAYLVWVVSQTFLVWLIADRQLWNSRARLAMEVIGIVLGGLFFAVEVLDFVQWTTGVYRRRKLMKAASKYRPPLYPIPGERLEAATTQRSNFLSRLIASNRPQQPIGEGAQLHGSDQDQEAADPAALAAPAASGGSPAPQPHGVLTIWQQHDDEEEEEAAGARPAAPAAAAGTASTSGLVLYTGAGAAAAAAAAIRPSVVRSGSCSSGEWHRPVTSGSGASAAGRGGGGGGAGPVAEGLETPFGAAATQFSGAAAAPPPSPAPLSAAAGGSGGEFEAAAAAGGPGGVAPMQQLYNQLSHGGAGGGGGGLAGSGSNVAASLAALQQQVAALQQMRLAATAGANGSTGGPNASSYSVPLAASVSGGLPPAAAGGGASAYGMASLSAGTPIGGGAGAGGGVPEPIDFVSVGLGPSALGLPGGLMGGPKPTFPANGQGQPKVTTMLRAPDAPDGPSLAGGEARDGAGRMSNPSIAGLTRVPSLGGSVGEGGEIRNRMRGGGGDNVGGSAMPRAATRRQVTKVNGMGGTGEAETADAAAQGAVDEEPQPDRTPAMVRHFRTFLHAYRGYLKRMVRDPIQFVHVFHNCATLVHFIVWATSFDGVGGGATDNIRLLEFDDVVVSLMALSGWGSVLYYSRGHPAVGQLMVLVEKCWWEVVKFTALYLFINIGFTLAFYMCANGSTASVLGVSPESATGFHPMANIGYGMIQLVRFMYGEADYDALAVSANHRVKTAFATIYFLMYVAVVLLLLCNVMVAMVVRVYSTGWSGAEKQWRLRWAQYVLRVEARMPNQIQQRFRLGEVSYDPVLQTRVYNHVFEVVEEQEREEERISQIKALEAAIDKIRSSGTKREAKRA